jgi:hypothetical protein
MKGCGQAALLSKIRHWPAINGSAVWISKWCTIITEAAVNGVQNYSSVQITATENYDQSTGA